MFNLVVGVTLNTFNHIKGTSGKAVLLTDSQNEWLAIQKMMAISKIPRKYQVPSNPLRRGSFRVVMSAAFDFFIIFVILANVVSMSVRAVFS